MSTAFAAARSWWRLPVRPPRGPRRTYHLSPLWLCAAGFAACMFILWLMFAMCWYAAVSTAWMFLLLWQGCVLAWRGLGWGVHHVGAAIADRVD